MMTVSGEEQGTIKINVVDGAGKKTGRSDP
jgi:hypothetical protein